MWKAAILCYFNVIDKAYFGFDGLALSSEWIMEKYLWNVKSVCG
jgi:hypothetical protein